MPKPMYDDEIKLAVEAYWAAYDRRSVTMRELMDLTGAKSTSVVSGAVSRLSKRGEIVYEPGISRSIRPIRRESV